MQKTILIMASAAAILLLMKSSTAPKSITDSQDDPAYQEAGIMDSINANYQDVLSMSEQTAPQTEDQNVAAFLSMIRVSEGTSGTNGYQTLVGGGLFDSFADHPRVLVDLPSLGIKSSAAGAYQILRRTWDGVATKLGLTDFSPANQDAAAVELIRQRGALADVKAGRFADAVDKCRKEWASLPGAGYGQHENTLAKLQAAYIDAGGVLA
jgi:muramidase (phage lysozyme)